jgi:hypothetical protein|uniref:Secreted protein n=1 Tax=Eutreptiella gymnastica TaxID=73025 RepID=A0A7S4CZ42_9EUGL|mmetsp:Transcript_3114/g.5816  ORF Transcript_3114/g.5816 Transcript_3114/m.5816 type:complete len:115 (+) Transcript_3114:1140-1484(+)
MWEWTPVHSLTLVLCAGLSESMPHKVWQGTAPHEYVPGHSPTQVSLLPFWLQLNAVRRLSALKCWSQIRPAALLDGQLGTCGIQLQHNIPTCNNNDIRIQLVPGTGPSMATLIG